MFGNNDGDKLFLKEGYHEKGVGEIYEDPYEFELAKKKLIVTHRPKIVEALALSCIYDVGHTHKAMIDKKGKTLAVNSRECCGCVTGTKTVAVLDLEQEEATIVVF